MDFFDEQFLNRQHFSAKEGIIEFVDIFPQEPRSGALPVLIACGWAESLQSIRETLHAIHLTGRRVIAIDPARVDHIGGIRSIFPADAYIKGVAYLRLLHKLGISKVDIVAHSEGAINALIATIINKEYFHRLILVAPAGMIKHDGIFPLAGRFLNDFLHIAKNGFTKKDADHEHLEQVYVKSVLRYFFMNPIQSLREALMLPHIQLKDMISRSRKQNIPIHLLLGTKDIVFPLERVKESLSRVKVESIDTYEGDHSTIHVSPEKIIPLIEKLLNS